MNDVTETSGQELAVLPRSALPTILAADQNDVLGKLAAELSDFEPDATTPAGRAEIGSKARKVGEAKMDLVRLANGLTEGWRKQTAAVVAERKIIEERMDGLRKQIEAPREEYNAREKRRTEAHEAAIRELVEMGGTVQAEEMPSSKIAELLDSLDDLHTDRAWEEFDTKAHRSRQLSSVILRTAYQTAKTREDEAEAARVAAEEEAQRQAALAVIAQREREERIAWEAAEAARIAAEEKAAREARDVQEKAQEALDAAEALRIRQAEEAAAKEREAAEALAKAESERLAGIERERVAAEKAEDARIAAHHAALIAIPEHPDYGKTETSAEIARRGRYLLAIDRDWEEFAEDARDVIEAEIERTRGLLAAAMARETEQLNAERIAAEAQTKADQAAAIKAEQDRVARAAAAQKAADDKRSADVAHRGRINREAALDVMRVLNDNWKEKDELSPEILARKVVEAIAREQIAHVRISY